MSKRRFFNVGWHRYLPCMTSIDLGVLFQFGLTWRGFREFQAKPHQWARPPPPTTWTGSSRPQAGPTSSNISSCSSRSTFGTIKHCNYSVWVVSSILFFLICTGTKFHVKTNKDLRTWILTPFKWILLDEDPVSEAPGERLVRLSLLRSLYSLSPPTWHRPLRVTPFHLIMFNFFYSIIKREREVYLCIIKRNLSIHEGEVWSAHMKIETVTKFYSLFIHSKY